MIYNIMEYPAFVFQVKKNNKRQYSERITNKNMLQSHLKIKKYVLRYNQINKFSKDD